jgi:membrane-associated phospholipid phosphatase
VKTKTLAALVKSNLSFLLPYLFFLVLGAGIMGIYSKADLHLLINEHTHGKADVFFKLITFLGDGLTVLTVSIIFLIFRVGDGLLLGISGILTGLITQILKHTVFVHMDRPSKYFEGVHELYLIPGVNNYSTMTFPSGHTASAFALYFALALLSKNNMLKSGLFLLAFLVGCSRVYLSQHFFQDMYAGSMVGVACTLLTCLLLSKVPFFRDGPWMDYSLVKNKPA